MKNFSKFTIDKLKEQINLKTDDGSYFVVTVENKSESSVNFIVEKIISGDFDNSDKEVYLKAFIKWDSCSHFHFGDPDGYIHLCGVKSYKNHIWLIRQLYDLAFKLMGCRPDIGEEWE